MEQEGDQAVSQAKKEVAANELDSLKENTLSSESTKGSSHKIKNWQDTFPELFKDKKEQKQKLNKSERKRKGSQSQFINHQMTQDDEFKEAEVEEENIDDKKRGQNFHKFIVLKDFQEFSQSYSRSNYHSEKRFGEDQQSRTKSLDLYNISEERREDDIQKKCLQKLDQLLDKNEFSDVGKGSAQNQLAPKVSQGLNSSIDYQLTIEETTEDFEKDKDQIKKHRYSLHNSQNNSAHNSPRIKMPKGDELEFDVKKKFMLDDQQPPETILEEEKQENEKQDNEKNENKNKGARRSLESVLLKLNQQTEMIQQIKVDEMQLADQAGTEKIQSGLNMGQLNQFDEQPISESDENQQNGSESDEQ